MVGNDKNDKDANDSPCSSEENGTTNSIEVYH